MTAFIFDLDGTLVESLPGIAKSLNLALVEHGLPEHSESAVIEFIGDGSRALCRQAIPEENPEEKAEVKEELVESVEARFKTHYTREWRDGTRPFLGIPELLALLQEKKVPIAVLSNKPHSFTKEIVETLFPAIEFSRVLGQKPEMRKKPDPAGAQLILTEFEAGCTAYLVGDSGVDMETAARASIASIAVTWGYEELHAIGDATHMVSSVEELRALLLSLVELR